VAIIYPAEKMSANAANSLLKTLEEPHGNTTIILICESLRRLPATIVSRCQRVRLPAPPAQVAVDWLAEQTSGADLANMLDFTGGAPLITLALHEADFAAMANQYAADLKNLEQRAANPVAVAGRWKKEPELALQWLYWKLARRVRAALEPPPGAVLTDIGVAPLHTPLAQKTLRASFRQMAQIRDLRRVISGGISAELNLAGLLMDWYGGLGEGN
jgi:DNA polymerase-3 subunit delta'